MKRFEYIDVNLGLEDPLRELNDWGLEGWQCVSIIYEDGLGLVGVLMHELLPDEQHIVATDING